MRFLRILVTAAIVLVAAFPQRPADPAITAALNGWWTAASKTREQRVEWWREARFGCFIHWGVYSGPGGEWKGEPFHGYAEHLMRIKKIPLEEYKREVVEKFNPVDFNADEWVRTIKGAGMKWIVITAKHHDGFAMYPSKVSRYNIHDATKFGRDPMRELSDACRRNGLKFGFYYSHAFDWEHPDAPGNDWDYDNPGGDRKLHGAEQWFDLHPELLVKARRYVDGKAIPQIRELIAMYHPDIMWFDTPQKLPVSEQLRIMQAAREAAPNMIINGRCARAGGYQFGDYQDTSDRAAEFPPTAGDWESIPTINESYGYHKFDSSQKPPEYFVRLLAKASARGGDILMNIGPMGNGQIDPRDKTVLAGIGKWLSANGESIYGAGRTPLAVQAWGESTRRGNTIYLQVFDWPRDGRVVVGGLRSTPAKAYLLGSHQAVKFQRRGAEDLVVEGPATAPDAADSVIALEFAGSTIEADPARLLSTTQTNVLRSFDAELRGGKLLYGDGKAAHAYVQGWSSTGQSLSWKVRSTGEAAYEVSIRYTNTSAKTGGEYEVRAGDRVVRAKVVPAAKEPEIKTAVVGRMVVPAGVHDLTIQPVSVEGGELMRLFELVLTAR
jgi:alpha-L-fucosidase